MATTLTPTVRNVTRMFRQSSPDQRAAGVEWYGRAHRLAVELADSLPTDHAHYGDIERAAAVIAVLSPRERWETNVKLARLAYSFSFEAHSHDVVQSQARFLAGVRTLGNNARKAWRLLATNEPTDEIVSGPKVTAFWRTIANPLDPFAVVVDRHALAVAVGRRVTDAEHTALSSGRRYEQACDVYRRAAVILAREYGPMGPSTVQAVTWTVWRETNTRCAAAARRERGGQ